jgi:hypothetical protein
MTIAVTARLLGELQCSPEKEKKIVRKARELIAPVDRWAHGDFARDRHRRVVDPTQDEADRFCPLGALQRAAFELGYNLQGDNACRITAERISYKLSPRHRALAGINDGPDGHRKVLALFDKAVRTKIAGRAIATANKVASTMTPEQCQRYGRLVQAITAQAASATESGLSADAAAKVLAEAVTALKPRTRYTIGREAALLPLLAILPDRMLDRIFAAALRPHFPKENTQAGRVDQRDRAGGDREDHRDRGRLGRAVFTEDHRVCGRRL